MGEVSLVESPAGSLREPSSPPPRARHFGIALGGIVLVALVLRVLYVLIVTRHENSKLYDAAWYEIQAFGLARGHFFPVFFGHGPDAAHPPLTSIVLVPVTYLFGLDLSATPQRLTMAFLGALVVLCAGVLGRRVLGPRAGLLAAGLCALYPNMWIPNGIVMSETLTMLLVALILLALYRFLRTPTLLNAALLGLGCGMEMLVRAELVLFLPFLIVPAALSCGTRTWAARLSLAAVGVLVACLTVGPWVGRNLVSFRDTTLLSTGEGPVLAGANCPQTYWGPGLGSWSLSCSLRVPQAADQSVESARQYDVGKRYVEHHLDRLPIVMLARAGRVWDFYEPLQMVDIDVNEGRPVPASFAGLLCYYALLPAAVAGVFSFRRRRVTLWPLLVIATLVTVIAVAGYGQVRFRAEFEVPLVILAAAGVEDMWCKLRTRATSPRNSV